MPILRFFPYESFQIATLLPPDIVQARLQHELTFDDKGGSSYSDAVPDTHFKGFAGKYKFDMKPYVNYSNVFLPKIKGTIEPAGEGSLIRAKMALSPSTTMLMTIWLIAVALACVIVGILAFRIITFKGLDHYLSNFNPITLLPFIMFVVVQVLVLRVFRHEGRKAKAIMLTLFEGKLIDIK